MATFQSEGRDEKVLAVLLAAVEPIGPTEIARRINEPWCGEPGYYLSSAIMPILRRIRAERHKGGKYSIKKGEA